MVNIEAKRMFEAKNWKRNEAKLLKSVYIEVKKIFLAKQCEAKQSEVSETRCPLASFQEAKHMRNSFCFALFRFEAKKFFLRNRRTLLMPLSLDSVCGKYNFVVRR